MGSFFATILSGVLTFWDAGRGERQTRLVQINDSFDEVYRMVTTNGGHITLYCTEKVYKTTFKRWWIPSTQHITYTVFGHCDDRIPGEFSQRITDGLTIGRLLPPGASRSAQKQAAIHAYVSLIASELGMKDQPLP